MNGTPEAEYAIRPTTQADKLEGLFYRIDVKTTDEQWQAVQPVFCFPGWPGLTPREYGVGQLAYYAGTNRALGYILRCGVWRGRVHRHVDETAAAFVHWTPGRGMHL